MPIKNSIKIGTLLGIAVSFFTYPMEYGIVPRPLLLAGNNDTDVDQNDDSNDLLSTYLIQLDDIDGVNLFTDMKNLTICQQSDFNRVTRLFDSHPLFTDENLPTTLAIIQVLEEPDEEERSQILKTIDTAVTRGAPLSSSYCFLEQPFTSTKTIRFSEIRFSDKTFYSVFKTMNDWIHNPFIASKLPSKIKSLTTAQNSIITTIFEAGDKRKIYINDDLAQDIYNELSIKVPQVILFLIFSWLHDEKNRDLIEQARQKFEPE